MSCEKDIFLYTCEKREYGIAACGGIFPCQHQEKDAVGSLAHQIMAYTEPISDHAE